MWIFRPASPDEAAEACAVIRHSIEQLCSADHDGDPAILGPWLANKTPERVRGWIAANPCGVLVGVGPRGIGGVGAVLRDGGIALNYVAPWARFQGVGKGLMQAMEAQALAWGCGACCLTSTATAHAFYRARGYQDVGDPIASFGGKPAFPMRKTLRNEDGAMTNAPGEKRTDAASRLIKASPHAIYQAFLDPQAVASWRPPDGMRAEIFAFDPSEGGMFRMAFAYTDAGHAVRGKTSEHADVFRGRFLELVPDQRIVEAVEFEAADPSFAGTMRITTTLAAVPGGTEVTIRCDDVPGGIRPEDHQAGLASTLRNLAAFTE